MIFRTNLLYSLEKLVNACIGESPESASKDDCFWNPIKVLTTIEGSYRYNLVAKVMKVVNLLQLWCARYQPQTKQRHEIFLRGSSVGYVHGRIEKIFTIREIQDFTREFQTNHLTAQPRCVYLSHSLLLLSAALTLHGYTTLPLSPEKLGYLEAVLLPLRKDRW